MYKFTLPNYKEDNIVNLMSSISYGFGKKHKYNKLNSLRPKELNDFENIVLLVIDGLGYNYLKKQNNSFLFKHIHSKLTTTFLSTTACANTAFLVGYPPQQHALTGWTINLKEVGGITEILPFVPRFGGKTLSKHKFNFSKIMDIKSFHKGFKGECFTIIEKEKSTRDFIKYVAKETKILPVKTYKGIFIKLSELVKKKSKKRRFIHAYMDEFDSIQHRHGVDEKRSNKLFTDIDKRIKMLSESIKDTNTKLIVVSDHGLINTTKESEIWVEDIPGLEECLTIPITGEPRVRDCFVRPSKVKVFEEIVAKKMSQCCWCFKGEQLIKDNFYGLGTPNKKLFDRVGDYVLIMKENYILRDKLTDYRRHKKFRESISWRI
jgi:predicted AlkP superfamily pyrophosphatase or phosphodiesterase